MKMFVFLGNILCHFLKTIPLNKTIVSALERCLSTVHELFFFQNVYELLLECLAR